MVGTPREVLSHKILMLNIKALAPTVPMLLARLMFKKIRSNSKDGMPDRLKTICTPPPPPIFDLGGIKKNMPMVLDTQTGKTSRE